MIYDINYFIEAKNDVDLINIDVNLKIKLTIYFSFLIVLMKQKLILAFSE